MSVANRITPGMYRRQRTSDDLPTEQYKHVDMGDGFHAQLNGGTDWWLICGPFNHICSPPRLRWDGKLWWVESQHYPEGNPALAVEWVNPENFGNFEVALYAAKQRFFADDARRQLEEAR